VVTHRIRRAAVRSLATWAVAAGVAAPGAADAGGGPLGIDRMWPRGEQGLFERDVQWAVFQGLIALSWAGALVEGTETRLGRTWWRSAEAGATALLGAYAAKRVFTRARPSQGGDPDAWFLGGGYQSFPSGEVSLATAVVLPFVIEYAPDHPAAWTLLAIPAYVSVARVRSQAHWPTDLIGAWLIGAGSAWLAVRRDSPLVLSAFGDGAFVGLRYRW
jgi:membrane-associated phospholipid phosphatase